MYIFMLTEGIIRARFNVGSNIVVCVVSLYNYSMVYLQVFSPSFNLNVTLFKGVNPGGMEVMYPPMF